MTKFSESMKFVAPVAKLAGFELEGTTAILGNLANSGLHGSMAGTALRSILLKLADTNSALSKKLGGSVKSSEELISGLNRLKEEGVDLNEMLELTDKRAVTAFGVLLEGSDTLTQLEEDITGTNEATRQYAIMMDTVEGKTFMHCCLGNGARAVFYIWKRMISYDEGQLKINLLLNRASPWADIHSYIPYEGKVDIMIKKNLDLKVRIPEWTQPGDVSCRVNGDRQHVEFLGRYVVLDGVRTGDTIEIMFPIQERIVKTKLGGKDFTLVIKGNDVVFIDPPGQNYPLYQRDHYRGNQVRWVRRERFVTDAPFGW